MKRFVLVAILTTIAIVMFVGLMHSVDAYGHRACTSNGGAVVPDSTDVGWHCQMLPATP